MNFALILRLSGRELYFARRKLFTVLYILTLGLMGPIFAGALRSSVDVYLVERSKQMLSADFSVSAMRPFKQKELSGVTSALSPLRTVEETEFVTMASTIAPASASTLVEVKAEESQFPIFGTFTMQVAGETQPIEVASTEALSKAKIAWVFPEVLAQLGIQIGDSLAIGRSEFKVTAVINEAPGQGRLAGVAPRIYIGRKFVEETHLTNFGSQVFHRLYFKLPRDTTAETASALVKASLQDPEIFVRTPDDAIQGFDRFFHFFSLYLGAVTMVVFALSWAGSFYILQIFLQDRLKNAAIFLVHGAGRFHTGALYAIQVLILMLLALVIAGGIVEGLIHLAPFLFDRVMPKGFVLAVSRKNWVSLVVIALGSSLAFTGPFFARLYSAKLNILLGESALGTDKLSRKMKWISYFPTFVVFIGLSIWLMADITSAIELAGGMAVAGLVGVLVGRSLFRFFFRSVKKTPGFSRLIATSLARSRFGVNLCFLSLVLVAIAMNLVPHLLLSVVSEVLPIQGKEIPAFFLFNIPEAQVEPLKNVALEKHFELRYLSPLVQGRLMKVNGEPTRSDQFQRFPVRLSYRPGRIPSESLVEGHELPANYNPNQVDANNNPVPVEISVETKFAERSGFKLGDRIEFDIQGVPVLTKITSLRKVKWSGFNPNFFIMFQPGVLDDAPKTWLANVNVEGDEAIRTKLQYDLIRRFPDLSVIDIGRTISRILEIARSVIGPVTAVAWVAVVLSFLILVGVISHNLRLRYPEVDIEKLMGADSSLIRRLLTGEYLVTAFFAWIVGFSSALLLAWIVVVRVLDVSFRVSWPAVGISWMGSVVVTTLIAWIAAGKVLHLRGASRKL